MITDLYCSISGVALSKTFDFQNSKQVANTLLRRGPMKPYLFFSVVISLSLCFVTAIDGFSPPSRPLRIHVRKDTTASNDVRYPQGLLRAPKSRSTRSRMPLTRLRGGFLAPLTANPILKSIGIYAFTDLIVGFCISVFTGSHVHLDLLGTGAFALAAVPYLQSSVERIRWSSAAIVVWGSKLALFLFYRTTKVKHDTRLTDLLSTTGGSFQFWFITLIWNIMASLPYLMGLGSDRENSVALVSGGILYSMGLAIESIADIQKYLFKQQQTGSQFCNIGLWKHSQHPNWFGNLVLWTGILVMNLPALIEPLPPGATDKGFLSLLLLRLWSVRKLVLGCLGPGFLWLLFNGQATGSITNSVELANAKYGNNPEYAKYVKDVPLIIPNMKFW